ncbi:MAG: matrixin family metalloprotease [Deltaproteobacteria bacterium]|nr:matrixin family metalloprotease [Deltaproteobacteria bacterium]
MNSRSLHAMALGLALCACFTADHASAYCRMTTQGGQQVGGAPCIEKGAPFFWSNPCLSYAVDSRGSRWFENPDGTPNLAEVEALVDQSFFAWTEADCGGAPPNLIFQPLTASTCKRAEFNTTGNVNTIAFLDPWKDPCADELERNPYDQFAFAVTVVWHNTTTGEIFDADMMINDQLASRFNAGGPYADCPDTGCPEGSASVPGPADLRSIITHEAGHFIGIGHSDVEEATMFSMAERTSVQKRTLGQDDIDAVCAIYPPGDLDASCNAAPLCGLQLNCLVTEEGELRACGDSPGNSASCGNGGGGCSAGGTMQSPGDTWGALLLALFGFTVLRRRSRRRAARS